MPSHVLAAIGEDPSATAMLRISLGRETSASDVVEAAGRILAAIAVACPGPAAALARAPSHS